MSWALRNTLYASGLIIIPYLYVAWRLVSAVKLIRPASFRLTRNITIGVVIWLNILPLIMLYYFANDTLLDEFVYRDQASLVDYLFLFPFWTGLIIILEISPYFMASDLIQGASHLFFPKIKAQVRQWTALFKLLLTGFFIIYVIWTVLSDTYQVKESRYTIHIDTLPDELNHLNLALIADLQVDRFTQEAKTDGVKKLIKNDKPDLLFFAGDLVTRGTSFIKQGVDVLCSLEAGTDRIACVGDHDFWSDPQKITTSIQDCGWTFLDNTHHIIHYGGKKILVTGIIYIYSRRISAGHLDTLLQNAPPADLKILLVHQPSLMVQQAARQWNYHILLAGHTHGGQVVFQPFGFEITPSKFENPFFSGYLQKDYLHIFITNGVGLTMMPLRYRAPAEVMRINVEK